MQYKWQENLSKLGEWEKRMAGYLIKVKHLQEKKIPTVQYKY